MGKVKPSRTLRWYVKGGNKVRKAQALDALVRYVSSVCFLRRFLRSFISTVLSVLLRALRGSFIRSPIRPLLGAQASGATAAHRWVYHHSTFRHVETLQYTAAVASLESPGSDHTAAAGYDSTPGSHTDAQEIRIPPLLRRNAARTRSSSTPTVRSPRIRGYACGPVSKDTHTNAVFAFLSA